MLQDINGSFATHFHEYFAILIININELLSPYVNPMRGRRRSKNRQEFWVYAHFWLMKSIQHQSPLRGAHYIFWNEGSLQIFTPYRQIC